MAKNDFVSLSLLKDQINKQKNYGKVDMIGQSLAIDAAKKKEAQTNRQNEARKADHVASSPRAQTAAVRATAKTAKTAAEEAKVAAEQSKKEYEDYKTSEEARKNQLSANKRALEEAAKKIFAVPGVSASDIPLTQKDAYAAADYKEQELKSKAEYYQNQEIAAESAATTAQNLKELESWSEEDRNALNRYIAERDAADQNIFGAPEFDKYNLNPIIQKYGQKKVAEMAESVKRQQNEVAAEQAKAAAEKANPILGSAASIGTSLIGAVTAPVEYVKEFKHRTGQYSTLDPNNIGTLPNTYGGTVREKTAQKIQGDGNNWLRNLAAMGYQGAMNALDSAARLAVAAGNPGVSALIAAGGSFGNGLQKYSQQGASPEQAAAMALLDAGIEYASEKISDAELLDFFKHGKDAKKAKDFLWHTFGLEPLSEEVSLFASTVAEMAVLGDKSSQRQRIGELVANGMSYQEAQAQVMRELWAEAGQTYVISAISAGLGSAGAYELGGKVNTNTATQAEQQAQEASAAPVSEGEQIARRAAEMMAQPKQEAPSPTVEPEQALNNAMAEVLGKQAEQEANVSQERKTSRISMEEFADNSSDVWKNVAYNDDATKVAITQQTHDEMVNAGKVVKVSDDVKNMVSDSYPDLRGMKKKERAPILKDAVNTLKKNLRSFLSSFTGKDIEFEINGKILDARLYSTGINEVLEKITQEKANMLYSTEEIFKNAQYLFSTPDYDGDSNVYRWNYFYTPVEIDGQTVGVRIAVRDMVTPQESQIYNWGIKKDAPLSNAGHTPNGRTSYGASSDTSNVIVTNNQPVVNQNNQIKGTGAAETGFTPKQALINQYGNIPEGENPVRPDQLPRSTNGNDRVSYTARTATEARVTPDEFVPLIERETVIGGFSFIPITNDATVQAATQNISREGWQTARANWTSQIRAGVTSPEITATGALLYNHAVNAGDHQEALDILTDYQMSVRNTAQALQAARILKTLTPSDRLYMIRRSIDTMVQDMHLQNPVTINEDLAQRYQNAGTQEEADEIISEIAQDVARQIPPTAMEAFTALRYLNMLGNFRTQVRNVAGNMGSKLVYGFKDKIGAALETIADAVTPGGIERTKSFTTDRNTRRAALDDYEAVQNWLMSNGRYEDNRATDDFARQVQENRRLLPPGLEQARRLTNWAMEAGDTLFARDAYARALAGYLNARGIRTDDLSTVDPDLLDRAREYAVRQAQEQTFRDNNQVSDFVSGIMRGRNTPTWARIIGEGVMPFRRTPANVLVRAEEYSPLGIINSAVNTIRAARGEITGAELIDSWAKTLTGTALFAIGKFMAESGVLSGGPDEDEEKDQFDQLNGKQDYALNFTVDGKTYSYTIDWATPAAMPMFMGAQLAKAMESEDFTWADMEKAITSIGDPLIQMSMLQGVNDTLENIRYAENNMGQFLINATMSYLTQGLTNTLLGQIERSTEENRQTTYIDKDSNVPQWLQRQLGKASQKIPGWDYQQTDYLNAWGEAEENEGGLLYNLLSPGYLSEEQKSAVSDELYRLREATGENVFPQPAEKTVTYTGKDGTLHKDYNLSAEEYDKLQKAEGQEAAKLIADLVNSADYAKLTDKQKAEVIKDVYEYAAEQGKKAALEDYHSNVDAWIQNMGSNKTEVLIRRSVVRTLDRAIADTIGNMKNGWKSTPAAEQEREELYKSYRAMDAAEKMKIREDADSETANYLEARDAGADHDEFVRVAESLYNIIPESGQSGARSVQKSEAVAKVPGISEKEKEMFIKQQVSDAQDKNIDDLKKLWKADKELKTSGAFTMDKFAKLYRDYEDYTKGTGKKDRTVKKWMADYNISRSAAISLYEVFQK